MKLSKGLIIIIEPSIIFWNLILWSAIWFHWKNLTCTSQPSLFIVCPSLHWTAL